MSGPSRITPRSRVELAYRLLDRDGNLVESSDEEGPMEFEMGAEEIFPALERGLIGLAEGEERTVQLEPEEAFGELDLEAVITLPRAALPAGLVPQVGEVLPLLIEPEEDGEEQDWEAEEIEGVVREVTGEGIVLDTNHPLAGHSLTFEVRVLRVRG